MNPLIKDNLNEEQKMLMQRMSTHGLGFIGGFFNSFNDEIKSLGMDRHDVLFTTLCKVAVGYHIELLKEKDPKFITNEQGVTLMLLTCLREVIARLYATHRSHCQEDCNHAEH